MAWESLIEIREDEALLGVAKPRLVDPKADTANRPFGRPPWTWLAILVASGLGVLTLGAIFYVVANNSPVKIAVDEQPHERGQATTPGRRPAAKPAATEARAEDISIESFISPGELSRSHKNMVRKIPRVTGSVSSLALARDGRTLVSGNANYPHPGLSSPGTSLPAESDSASRPAGSSAGST